MRVDHDWKARARLHRECDALRRALADLMARCQLGLPVYDAVAPRAFYAAAATTFRRALPRRPCA